MTLFRRSFISCYYSSRERTDSLDDRNSHSCADSLATVSFVCQLHTLHYFSLFFSTKCILSGMLIQAIAFAFSIISKFFCLSPSSFFLSSLPNKLMHRPIYIYIHISRLIKAEKAMLFFYLTMRCECVTANF